jgi:Activator of Hsp90 ATPase homolog 1-like protein
MSAHDYTTSFTVPHTPAEVFAVNSPRGWWSTDIEGTTDRVGEEFVFEVPGVHYSKIRVTELIPGELVAWRVVDAAIHFVADRDEWTDTEIRFELTEAGSGTDVRFTHDGLVPAVECYEACATAWSFYVSASLRNLITTGTGNPGSNPDEERYKEKARAR